MKQKIELYREVLELEPNSKVFFPLAKMQSKALQTDEAITTLQHGLARHPDHLEARLLLIEILLQQGQSELLGKEVDRISQLLSGYPGFWQAWAEKLYSSKETQDAGLAVSFLAAYLQRSHVSWASIIEHGLKSLLGSIAAGEAPAAAPEHSMPAVKPAAISMVTSSFQQRPLPPPPPAEPAVVQNHVTEETLIEEPVAPVVPEPATLTVRISARKADVAASPPQPSAPVLPVRPGRQDENVPENKPGDVDAAFDDEDSDEPFSLRTRSMAAVLTEQGDFAGALDIYKELLNAAVSEGEKAELLLKIDELSHKINSNSASADADKKSDETLQQAPESKNRLTDMLEALAHRLEARALH